MNWGLLFLVVMLSSAFAAYAFFRAASQRWKIGVMPNLVGAFFLFCTLLAFEAWVLGFVTPPNRLNGLPLYAPVPWYSFLGWAFLSAGAYAADYLGKQGSKWIQRKMLSK